MRWRRSRAASALASRGRRGAGCVRSAGAGWSRLARTVSAGGASAGSERADGGGRGRRGGDAAQVEIERSTMDFSGGAFMASVRRRAPRRGRTAPRLMARSSLSYSRFTAATIDGIVSRDGALPVRALQAGVEDDRADVPAGERETLREELEVDLARVDAGGINCLPDAQPLLDAGQREIDHEAQPAQEGLVEVLLAIGGEDREALEALHALEQVADLEVGVAVVRVLDLGALAEERVGFVEEQDRRRWPRRRRTGGAGSSRSRRCICSRPARGRCG